MAFKNEYVSEDDIRDFGLDNLVAAENKLAWRDGRPKVFRHQWTVDRERNVFLIQLTRVIDYNTPSGAPVPTKEEVCLLSIEGECVRFHLTLQDESSRLRSERPYRVVWKITDVIWPESSRADRSEVMNLMREAISVRGKFGASSQVPDTVTSFKE